MGASITEQLQALLTLVVAAALGGAVGLNREWTGRPAGLRTHMLVAIGAALVMSMAALHYSPETAGRLAASVVTGIGFLGGGVIIQRKAEVQGLTTAASLWLVAVIGLTAGAQLYLLAAGATVLGWFVLAVLLRITRDDVPGRGEGEDED